MHHPAGDPLAKTRPHRGWGQARRLVGDGSAHGSPHRPTGGRHSGHHQFSDGQQVARCGDGVPEGGISGSVSALGWRLADRYARRAGAPLTELRERMGASMAAKMAGKKEANVIEMKGGSKNL